MKRRSRCGRSISWLTMFGQLDFVRQICSVPLKFFNRCDEDRMKTRMLRRSVTEEINELRFTGT